MNRRIASLLVGALIGAFYWWVLVHFWGTHGAEDYFKWLRSALPPREHRVLVGVITHSYDVILNVLLAVPFASLFVVNARLNNWWCIAAAVLVATVTIYWGTEWGGDPPLIKFWQFWFSLATSIVALPAAFIFVRKISSR